MHDASLVGHHQRFAQLGEDPPHLVGGEAHAPGHEGAELLALKQLHHQVRNVCACIDSVVGDRYKVRTSEVRAYPSLKLEASPPIGVAHELRVHRLQRAQNLPVTRLVHEPHATAAEGANDLVTIGDEGSRSEVRHVR